MDNMFAAVADAPGMSFPMLETRKALIIINLQNDSLYVKDDFYLTKNHDFVSRLKEMIPYFRKHGDVIWVITHMGIVPSALSTPEASIAGEDAANADEDSEEQSTYNREAQMRDGKLTKLAREEARRGDLDPIDPDSGTDYPMYHPSSKTREMMAQASVETRAAKRSADFKIFDDGENLIEESLRKPKTEHQFKFFLAGTKGAQICDDLLGEVDDSRDLMVTKRHYSAFDSTSLLTALRANLVTEVYLCGCLTNVGVYATAADAVQHGLSVTVVEDCLGYRSEEKHEEAMRQMADIMGVNGIDSEEIIEESGGRPVPDAETPGITLEELSINSPRMATARAGSGITGMTGVESVSQQDGRRGPGAEAVAGSKPNTSSNLPPTKLTTKSIPPIPKSPAASSTAQGAGKRKQGGDHPRNPSPGPAGTKSRRSWNLNRAQNKSKTLGPKDSIGAGDSKIIHEVLSPPLIETAFDRLKDEVGWQTMLHRSGQVPRLVAVQGQIGAGGQIPIYRHPADESPPLFEFTPTLEKIRREVESLLGQSFNHALIQLYRDGVDNISEHSDKTLDIVRGSVIVNVSIGAQRIMTLRTKKSKHAAGSDSPSIRPSQRIKMPHNSVFVLGPQTNREWLHGVRADKRPNSEKTEDEKAFGGERISITFRQIGTFMNQKDKTIWGAGAKQKSKKGAGRISTKDNAQMEAMINAFGKENHHVDFDWDKEYGPGFDVVNLVNEQAKLQLCSDSVANTRAQLCLCEKSISFTTTEERKPPQPKYSAVETRYKTWMHGLSNVDNPVFYDVDDDASEIEGDLAILFYLEKNYPFQPQKDSTNPPSSPSRPETRPGEIYSQISQSNDLLFLWRQMSSSQHEEKSAPDRPTTHRFELERPATPVHEEFHATLELWEEQAEGGKYIVGDEWTIVDCAFWPVLNHIVLESEELDEERYPNLLAYHTRGARRECVKLLLEKNK